MLEIAKETLDAFGETCELGDIQVTANGIRSTVAVYQLTDSDTRSESLDSDALAAALQIEDVETNYIIEFTDNEEVGAGAAMTRSSSVGDRNIEISLPSGGDDYLQILLVTDENGVASWHLPEEKDEAGVRVRGVGTDTFIISGHVIETPSQNDSKTRGILGRLGRKIVRVLGFWILDKAIGEIGDYFVGKWEEKKRPYGIRTFTPNNYRNAIAPAVSAQDWERFSKGPCLLFVHGTFSRAFSAFQLLPETSMQALYDQYEGRIFAFDHMTLSEDPVENAAWFVRNLPEDIDLSVDIVCHSRGGHVSRVLSEQQAKLPMDGRQLNLRKIIFVASPNRGTILTEAEYMGNFIDSYTNILGWLPDNAITDFLEIIIATLKQIAAGTLKGLDGLQAMNPNGDFMERALNQGPAVDCNYYGITADYEPLELGFNSWARDRLMDKIFMEANDLVVPSKGVYEGNGDQMFPITESKILRLDRGEGVHHMNFFGNSKTVAKILEWLRF